MSPDKYLVLLIGSELGFVPQVKSGLSLPNDFFPDPTTQEIAAYTTEVVELVWENRVEEIHGLYEKGSIRTLQSCNRFGGSLLHLACRRGYTEMVKFLLNQGGVSARRRDDIGRTPFHDACWRPSPMFEILNMLIKQGPILLFVADKRGNTPFDYARKEHWKLWINFLYARRNIICPDPQVVLRWFL